MLLPRHESRLVPELTPVHKAYELALSQEPVTPVLVVETAGASTLLTDPTISPFITAQVVHSPQFTELRTHEETPSTDKPSPEQVEPEELSPEQEGHKEPNLEVHFEQALDIHKEPIQLAPQLILPAPQQVAPPMAQQAQQPTVLITKLRGEPPEVFDGD
jgi:hypothetical protein